VIARCRAPSPRGHVLHAKLGGGGSRPWTRTVPARVGRCAFPTCHPPSRHPVLSCESLPPNDRDPGTLEWRIPDGRSHPFSWVCMRCGEVGSRDITPTAVTVVAALSKALQAGLWRCLCPYKNGRGVTGSHLTRKTRPPPAGERPLPTSIRLRHSHLPPCPTPRPASFDPAFERYLPA